METETESQLSNKSTQKNSPGSVQSSIIQIRVTSQSKCQQSKVSYMNRDKSLGSIDPSSKGNIGQSDSLNQAAASCHQSKHLLPC